ncbi:transducin/WD40 repeat-like superfamily protein [Tasmannia lanceolata]|uniref:transducin/WD40 repeat-like superfamily protein n=1 Tax=Tasmannia lanceolata TaxID=3420 RepID=UPI004062B323
MQSSNRPSFFQDLKTRELNGFRVKKRPYLDDLSSDSGGQGTGVVMIKHKGEVTPPLSVSFCNTSRNSHFLAVSDEDGYVSFYDTRRRLPSLSTCQENAEEARICDWIAHNNAIFDLCWIKDDTRILTASGDQSIKVWDSEKQKCINAMADHKGSVKSLCSHPSNPDLIVSGSRDGSFALWDLRCTSSLKSISGATILKSTAIVKDAHVLPQKKRARRGKAANTSVTSVLYLNDEISIASAGSMDSVVKFWDTRSLKAQIAQTFPHFEPSSLKERGLHGISSLTQDSSGVFLAASCMDDRIYLYDVLQLDKGPVKTFYGSQIKSFYVKSAISPDAAHILSGSSDGNAYIWQVKKPKVGPVVLKGHEGEVSAVDWCPSETGKIATASDDFMVRIWNIQKGGCSNTSSPSSIRRRVMAIPSMECRKLVMDEPPPDLTKVAFNNSPSDKPSIGYDSPVRIKTLETSTPESIQKKISMSSFLKDGLEMQRTPEAELKSPSSVLNPPPSLKRRTIRDYFLAVS